MTFDFAKASDRDTLQELFLGHLKRQDIIPFFGSGFTRGHSAAHGIVPSVEELKAELTDIISEIQNYSEKDRSELKQMKLSDLADIFWPTLEDEKTSQTYRDSYK